MNMAKSTQSVLQSHRVKPISLPSRKASGWYDDKPSPSRRPFERSSVIQIAGRCLTKHGRVIPQNPHECDSYHGLIVPRCSMMFPSLPRAQWDLGVSRLACQFHDVFWNPGAWMADRRNESYHGLRPTKGPICGLKHSQG